jgi:hypothetical protein
MSRFGDRPQNVYERNVMLGFFEIKTEPLRLTWINRNNMCTHCFNYSTEMYVWENTGDNSIPMFDERKVDMARWEMDGEICCEN